jgi:hypothetical protein
MLALLEHTAAHVAHMGSTPPHVSIAPTTTAHLLAPMLPGLPTGLDLPIPLSALACHQGVLILEWLLNQDVLSLPGVVYFMQVWVGRV